MWCKVLLTAFGKRNVAVKLLKTRESVFSARMSGSSLAYLRCHSSLRAAIDTGKHSSHAMLQGW